MPFNIPYGAPDFAPARASSRQSPPPRRKRRKHGWALNVAVVDSGANLVAFGRMDGAQLGSIAISEHKARGVGKIPPSYQSVRRGNSEETITNISSPLDDVIGSRGGHFLSSRDGKLIGAIGCSGGRGLAGRGRLHDRRGDDQQIATGAAGLPAMQTVG